MSRFQRPGGFHPRLSEEELEAARQHPASACTTRPGIVDYKIEMLDHARSKKMLPRHRARGGRRQLLPARRPRELAAPVPRAAHRASRHSASTYLPSHRVETITHEGGEFRLTTPQGELRAAKVVLAAGNANMRLAPMVGLERADGPERAARSWSPSGRGRSCNHPVVTLRQTDEGTVMIGDSKEERTDPAGLTHSASAPGMADRAVRHVPAAGAASTWCAPGAPSASMTQDGFPIYDESRDPSRRLHRLLPFRRDAWRPTTRSPSRR